MCPAFGITPPPGAAYIFRIAGKRGDLNNDGAIDVADIDTIAKALQIGDMDLNFDLNKDRQVTTADHRFLITDILKTWIGDANLDGEFNTADFVMVFQAGQFEDEIVGNSTWSTGDWNGDGEFTSVDFIVSFQDGGFERGPRIPAVTVPEPGSILLLLVAGIGVALRRGHQARRKPQQKREFGWVFGVRIGSVVVAGSLLHPRLASADIFRWDNGALIPGTQDITLESGFQLAHLDLRFTLTERTRTIKERNYPNKIRNLPA